MDNPYSCANLRFPHKPLFGLFTMYSSLAGIGGIYFPNIKQMFKTA